jgi:hypothetical protein
MTNKYSDQLPTLKDSRPLLAEALVLAEQRRTTRLTSLASGARLRGLEQLFTYLDAATKAYAELPALAGIAFLVERVKADYQTALEATLSGYQGVAADAMRDVMEIECLLLDFASTEGLADEWLTADESLRRRKYTPVKVRKRLQESGIKPYANDDFEPVDYKAHSEALHVTPSRPPIAGRGPELLQAELPFQEDFGFVEMFEHGSRVLMAIELLRMVALGVPDEYEPLTARDDFDDAHARTHQIQVMLIALLEGPAVLRERLGRAPTRADLLKHLAEEVAAKSWPFGPR